MTDRNDKSLLEAHMQGDPTAFDQLVRRHGGAVLGYLQKMTGDATQAEDMFQETFRRVHEKAHTLRSDNVKAWLFTIATRIALDNFRKEKRFRMISLNQGMDCKDGDCQDLASVVLIDETTDPARSAEQTERIEQVRRAILELPAKQRVTLILGYYQQLSYASIAEVLGCSHGTVKTQMFRALKSLAGRLPEVAGEIA
ncbi:MAG: sigma-70 family RNA polymerase sigma factor [Sedimentisphaerales bacterium]|nr:sigma-70 family RNA polymerase sigma factor [Sedimentisphaerales bacterium]